MYQGNQILIAFIVNFFLWSKFSYLFISTVISLHSENNSCVLQKNQLKQIKRNKIKFELINIVFLWRKHVFFFHLVYYYFSKTLWNINYIIFITCIWGFLHWYSSRLWILLKSSQKNKMAVWGGLTNSCEKKWSEKHRRKGKI